MSANQNICFWVPLGFDQSEALLLGTSETAGNVSLIKTCGPFSSFEHQSSKLNRKFVPCFLRAKSRAKNVVTRELSMPSTLSSSFLAHPLLQLLRLLLRSSNYSSQSTSPIFISP